MSNKYDSADLAMQHMNLLRRIIEKGFTNQQFDVFDQIISPEILEHQPGLGVGPQGVKGAVAYLHSVFPDFTLTIEDITYDGEKVWARLRARGTQRGPHMSMPSTGKPIDVTVFDICRFEDGKMVEHWGVPDRFAIMEQLGMLPVPGPPQTA